MLPHTTEYPSFLRLNNIPLLCTFHILFTYSIKITMRYHLTPISMAIIKKTNFDKEVKLEPLYTMSRNAKWCSHCGKEYGSSSKN